MIRTSLKGALGPSSPASPLAAHPRPDAGVGARARGSGRAPRRRPRAFGLAAADPVAEDDDRVFRPREAVEGAFDGHRSARSFDGPHDALLEGGLRGPV